VSLLVIVTVLAVGVAASAVHNRQVARAGELKS
jgi:hypothetical protein